MTEVKVNHQLRCTDDQTVQFEIHFGTDKNKEQLSFFELALIRVGFGLDSLLVCFEFSFDSRGLQLSAQHRLFTESPDE